MTVAVSKALEDGRARGRLRVDREHGRLGRRVRGARRARRASSSSRRAPSRPGSSRRRAPLGARVLEVRGSFDEALAAARELAERGTHVLVNSLNPHRLEGQKTAAFEIVEELGGAPDVLALPYGGGGNLVRLRARLRRGRRRHAAPRRRRGGRARRRPSRPRSASPSRRTRRKSTRRSRASGGAVVSLTDDAILAAWRELAHERGRLLRAVVRRRARRARATSSSSRARASSASSPGTGSRTPRRPRASARRPSPSTRSGRDRRGGVA